MALSQLASSSSRSANLLKPLSAAISLRRPISTDTTPLTVETSVPFASHQCEAPSLSVQNNAKELFTFFRDMALMRRMEIAADSLYKAKLIRGYDGQEAVAVGMEAAIIKKDCIITKKYYFKKKESIIGEGHITSILGVRKVKHTFRLHTASPDRFSVGS